MNRPTDKLRQNWQPPCWINFKHKLRKMSNRKWQETCLILQYVVGYGVLFHFTLGMNLMLLLYLTPQHFNFSTINETHMTIVSCMFLNFVYFWHYPCKQIRNTSHFYELCCVSLNVITVSARITVLFKMKTFCTLKLLACQYVLCSCFYRWKLFDATEVIWLQLELILWLK